MKTHLKIDPLAQAAESAHLEKSLEAIPGVQSVRLDPQRGVAIIEHENADLDLLVATARGKGFDASLG